jgi:hypothetical protein
VNELARLAEIKVNTAEDGRFSCEDALLNQLRPYRRARRHYSAARATGGCAREAGRARRFNSFMSFRSRTLLRIS